MSAKPKEFHAEPITIARLAREALSATDGNVRRATDALVERMAGDANLLREVIRAAVTDAVNLRVQAAHRHNRAAILRVTTGGRAGVEALAAGLTAAILDMPLARGVKLRDATREEVVEQAERYAAQASDMGHKARWLRLIAQAVPAGKRVGEVMTDERAAELHAEARHG